MFLERSLHMQFGDRGLTQIMNNPQLGHTRANETRDRIAPLMIALVERAQQQGTVPADPDTDTSTQARTDYTAVDAQAAAHRAADGPDAQPTHDGQAPKVECGGCCDPAMGCCR
jgi:hypothetical protein